MEEKQIVVIGTFCLNELCEDYNKVNHGNVIKSGRTDKEARRYLCKTYKKSFTEAKGTIFYHCCHTKNEIVEYISVLVNCNSLADIYRIKGIKEEIVMKWLEKASAHVKQFERLVRKKKLTRMQFDVYGLRPS